MQQVATYETVARACERLKSEGQKVTGRAVLSITGGSLGTVLRYIKKWRQGAAQAPTALPSEIPAELQSSILRALGLAQAEAAAKLEEDIEQATARETEALEGLANAEALIEKLAAELKELRAQFEQELQSFEKSKAVAAEKIESLESRAQDLQTERQQLVESGEKARTEAAKALLQVERADMATEKAEARVRELKVDLQTTRDEKVSAEKAQAVAEQKSTDLADQLADARAALAELKSENRVIVAEQKKEIQELRAKNAELEKRIAGFLIEKTSPLSDEKSKEQR